LWQSWLRRNRLAVPDLLFGLIKVLADGDGLATVALVRRLQHHGELSAALQPSGAC
jgi:predicted ester cyclase